MRCDWDNVDGNGTVTTYAAVTSDKVLMESNLTSDTPTRELCSVYNRECRGVIAVQNNNERVLEVLMEVRGSKQVDGRFVGVITGD